MPPHARLRAAVAGVVAISFASACGHAASFRVQDRARRGETRGDCLPRHAGSGAARARIGGPRIAVVIGNDAYASGQLANAGNDANAMAVSLTALGFTVSMFRDVNRETMRRAVAKFRGVNAEGGIKLFFYAGHGIAVDGKNYLVPVDAELTSAESVASQATAAEDVLTAMSESRGGSNIMILDACRNNPLPARARSQATRGLVEMRAPSGSLIAYATAPGETALDGDLGRGARDAAGSARPATRGTGHGIFTGALLQHIASPGLTVEQMLKRTAADVKAATRDAQRPWTATDFAEDIYLNPTGPAQPEALIALARSNLAAREHLSVLKDTDALLRGEAGALSEAVRAEAEALHAEAERDLVRVELSIEPRDATLWVANSMYSSRDGHVCLNPGDHDAQISEPGYQPMTRALHLAPGSSVLLDAQLQRESYGDYRPKLSWAAGATGAAALTVALGTRLGARRLDRKLDAICDGSRCPATRDDWKSMQERGERLVISSGAMLGVGLAGLTLGTLLRLRPQWFGSERKPQASAFCGEGGCRADVSVSF